MRVPREWRLWLGCFGDARAELYVPSANAISWDLNEHQALVDASCDDATLEAVRMLENILAC